ncbi:NADH-quinone oxidoreductase subunit N [Buchnera aphidicola (Cinara pseudotaxifoliae)]|uniref:NADH-quinone oxidoreductase subunit N n=1 Tax=Buchnera aphidicola (Cinara pseudotaxifoliae) TaxID=655384 RepID=A0A451DGK8_9GAMM|nr:NADH-quinone oxidoreductase subunit N [Buchnera aphidicola]VFP85752.1 NADH-quinone oxidoreductase subunit N [Buchnera aphidicola (Cinara pseudotaxifoliae)]
MIRLFDTIIPIIPILLLIFSIIGVFCISFYRKNIYLGFMISIISILFSMLTVLYSRIFIKEYISELIKIDKYSYFFIFMILFSSLYTCIFAYPWLLKKNFYKTEFYLFILLASLGGILVSISHHFAALFIGIELLFFSMLGILIFFSKCNNHFFSILVYLIVSVFSSAILLLGCSFIYLVSGRLCFSFLKYIFIYYPSIMYSNMMLYGISMIFLSICFKLSLFPLHTWSPDIYQYTNSCALLYFSTVTKISVLSCLLRFFYYIPYIVKIKSLYLILYYIAIFSIFLGNIAAIFQKEAQRLIGYLSISNFGIILIVMLTYPYPEYIYMIKHICIYVFGYLLGLIGFFSIKSVMDFNTASSDINNIQNISLTGLYLYNPFLGSVMTIIFLSLSGFPLTLGFWGKFFVFKHLLHKHFFMTTMLIMLSSIMGVCSYLHIIHSLYCQPSFLSKKNSLVHINMTIIQKFLIIFIGIILIVLGLFPQMLFKIF